MRKQIEWEWEKLDETTFRSKVIGGWLVLHCTHTIITSDKKREMVRSESMQFVADRDHEWSIAPHFDPSDAGKKHNTVNAEDFMGTK